jgi:hypothetical protein
MTVIDASGTRIGKVEFVKLGDPEAVTVRGEDAADGEADIAGELRQRLLRMGFVKVAAKASSAPTPTSRRTRSTGCRAARCTSGSTTSACRARPERMLVVVIDRCSGDGTEPDRHTG